MHLSEIFCTLYTLLLKTCFVSEGHQPAWDGQLVLYVNGSNGADLCIECCKWQQALNEKVAHHNMLLGLGLFCIQLEWKSQKDFSEKWLLPFILAYVS